MEYSISFVRKWKYPFLCRFSLGQRNGIFHFLCKEMEISISLILGPKKWNIPFLWREMEISISFQRNGSISFFKWIHLRIHFFFEWIHFEIHFFFKWIHLKIHFFKEMDPFSNPFKNPFIVKQAKEMD